MARVNPRIVKCLSAASDFHTSCARMGADQRCDSMWIPCLAQGDLEIICAIFPLKCLDSLQSLGGSRIKQMCENPRLYGPLRHLTLLKLSRVILCSHGWTSAVIPCGYLVLPKETGDHLSGDIAQMIPSLPGQGKVHVESQR